MATKLFAYGTLKRAHAPKEIAHAVNRFRLIGRGRVRGQIYDLGEYPAAILANTGKTGTIEGEVFEVPDAETLRALDAYEEFDSKRPAQSLFVRKRKLITLDNGKKVECWVYEYNRPLPSHARRLS